MKWHDKNIKNKINLDNVLENAVTEAFEKEKINLQEAYVAEKKPFKQVSEFVSQKTKDAHTELYKNYIETLNEISSGLGSGEKGAANSRHSEYRSLKLDEVYNLNAV